MFRLIGVEFFKLRKRWMPYVILVLLLGFMIFTVINHYSSYHRFIDKVSGFNIQPSTEVNGTALPSSYVNGNSENGAGKTVIRPPYFNDLVLPEAMEGKFNSMGFAPLLMIILAASMVGMEYRNGTLRQSLIRGINRGSFFISKIAALLIAALFTIIVAAVLGFIASLITTQLVTGSVSWEFLTGNFIGYLFSSIGRLLLSWGAYIALAVFVAVLFRSQMVGVAVGLVFFIGETALLTMALNSDDWLVKAAHYSIGYNVQYFTALNSPFTGAHLIKEFTTNFWQSGSILLVYIIVLTGGAFFIFRRQDLPA